MDIYNKMLEVTMFKTNYPFNQKTKDNIEFTRNELELYYIKKYDKCIKSNNNIEGSCEQKILIYI